MMAKPDLWVSAIKTTMQIMQKIQLALWGLLFLTGCAASKPAFVETGQGSYYADKFEGRPTASGAIYHANGLTAAHNTLPFGTQIRVLNQRNGRSVEVVVNDRGPHVKGRIVDVSGRAARQLDLVRAGVVPVEVRVTKAAKAKKPQR